MCIVVVFSTPFAFHLPKLRNIVTYTRAKHNTISGCNFIARGLLNSARMKVVAAAMVSTACSNSVGVLPTEIQHPENWPTALKLNMGNSNHIGVIL